MDKENKEGRVGRIPIVVFILAGAAVVIGALFLSRPSALTKTPEERVWHVKATQVSIGERRPTLFLLGKVESPDNAQLTSAIEADVTLVSVRAGQSVEAGAELVRLDDREAKERLRQREAELSEVEAQIKSEHNRHHNDIASLEQEQALVKLAADAVERVRKLETRELSSRNQVDEAIQAKARQELSLLARQLAIEEHPARLSQLEARKAQAQARLVLARIELDRTVVIAPYPAMIAAVNVAPGQRVRVGDKVLSLFPRHGIELRAQVPARYLAPVQQALNSGEPIAGQARLDGGVFPVKLERLAAQVASGSAGVDAFLHVEADTSTLQLGRVVEILLSLPELEGVFAVSRESLYGMERVYKIKDGRLIAVAVELAGDQMGWDDSGGLLLRAEGITDADLVLATKFANAVDGLAVLVDEIRP